MAYKIKDSPNQILNLFTYIHLKNANFHHTIQIYFIILDNSPK